LALRKSLGFLRSCARQSAADFRHGFEPLNKRRPFRIFLFQFNCPNLLAAAGYADKDPVGDNTTDEGKEQNRRIEIILVPDLSELPQLTDEPTE